MPEYNTRAFPSLSITNYRRTGYFERLRLRSKRDLIIIDISQGVNEIVQNFNANSTKVILCKILLRTLCFLPEKTLDIEQMFY